MNLNEFHSASVVWALQYSRLVAQAITVDNLSFLPTLGLICDWFTLYPDMLFVNTAQTNTQPVVYQQELQARQQLWDALATLLNVLSRHPLLRSSNRLPNLPATVAHESAYNFPKHSKVVDPTVALEPNLLPRLLQGTVNYPKAQVLLV